jgi:hypothetical protein
MRQSSTDGVRSEKTPNDYMQLHVDNFNCFKGDMAQRSREIVTAELSALHTEA